MLRMRKLFERPGCNEASPVIQLGAAIERIWKIHMGASMELDGSTSWRWSMHGVLSAESEFISQLACNRGNETMSLYL
jgi:hypothetical protein